MAGMHLGHLMTIFILTHSSVRSPVGFACFPVREPRTAWAHVLHLRM